jgi:hypothetical protein
MGNPVDEEITQLYDLNQRENYNGIQEIHGSAFSRFAGSKIFV